VAWNGMAVQHATRIAILKYIIGFSIV